MFHVKQWAQEAGFALSDKALERLKTFAAELTEANKVMNLTAITEPEEIEIKHMVDSLLGGLVINELKEKDDFSLIDVGTGAGFPGLPLKIAFSEGKFTLLDSLNKRITFLDGVIKKLGLQGALAVAARAEDYARGEMRESFDFAASRAVARTNVLLEYLLPMVRDGGYCLLYKSGNYEEELEEAKNALSILGGEIHSVRDFSLPADGGTRSIIVIKKTGHTPDRYPRKAGKPSKSPL